MPQLSKKSEKIALLVLFHTLHLGPHLASFTTPWDKQQTTGLELSSWRWRCSFGKLQVNGNQHLSALGTWLQLHKQYFSSHFSFCPVSSGGALSEFSLSTKHVLSHRWLHSCSHRISLFYIVSSYLKNHIHLTADGWKGLCPEELQDTCNLLLGAWIGICHSEFPTPLYRVNFSTAVQPSFYQGLNTCVSLGFIASPRDSLDHTKSDYFQSSAVAISVLAYTLSTSPFIK